MIERFLKRKDVMGRLAQAQDILMELEFHGVLLDLLSQQNKPIPLHPDQSPIEYSALRAAYSDGYNAAVRDLFYFRQLYVDTPEVKKEAQTDFGAKERILANQDMTEKEYNELITAY